MFAIQPLPPLVKELRHEWAGGLARHEATLVQCQVQSQGLPVRQLCQLYCIRLDWIRKVR